MRINLNDYIRVRLTDLGKNIYYHQFDEINKTIKNLGGKPIEPLSLNIDSDGKARFQLWDFIALYGNYIGIAKPNVIEPLELEVEDTEYTESEAEK